jgi:hypothetical protein
VSVSSLGIWLPTYLPTYLPTWSRLVFRADDVPSDITKFPVSYGTRKFITVSTRARQRTISLASRIKSTFSRIGSWKSVYYHVIYSWVSQLLSSLLIFWLIFCTHFCYTCYVPRPSHPQFYVSTWQCMVKSTNYEALRYGIFVVSCYFLSLRSKYSPQHPVLKHSQCFLPLVWETKLGARAHTPTHTKQQVTL